MRKLLFKTVLILLLLLTIATATFYWLMQSQYAAQVVNYLLKQYSSAPVSVSSVEYSFPNQLLLQGIELGELNQQPIYIEHAEIWFSKDSILKKKLIIDSLLLSDLSLQDGLPALSLSLNTEIRQLAVAHLDYSDKDIVARDIGFQIRDPKIDWQKLGLSSNSDNEENTVAEQSSNQQVENAQSIATEENVTTSLNTLNKVDLLSSIYGKIQFSAAQVYWQGEAINNILLDTVLKPEDSTIYGLSFDWRDTQISGQAEEYKQGWSLINVTIDKLRVNQQEYSDLAHIDWPFFLSKVYHINSLDLLNSTLELPNIQLTNGNISIENVLLPFALDSQDKGYISLNAESIRYLNQIALEPSFKLHLNQESLAVDDFSANFKQGQIYLQGEFNQQSAHLDQLYINGLKWLEQDDSSAEILAAMSKAISSLNAVTIDQLKIDNSQVIQLKHSPHWQASGLTINGDKLELIRDASLGLWNGNLRIRAANASYKQLLTTQPSIEMNSNNGQWQLTDLFVPLENGLVEAVGEYRLNQVSQPWRIEASADGLPLQLLTPWLPKTIEPEGLTEFQLSLQGLAGDALMLQHSLTGELIGSIRESAISIANRESKLTGSKNTGIDGTATNIEIETDTAPTITVEQTNNHVTPFESSEVYIRADRGRIEVKPIKITGADLTGQLNASYDLAGEEEGKISLDLTYKCTQSQYDLITLEQSDKAICSSR